MKSKTGTRGKLLPIFLSVLFAYLVTFLLLLLLAVLVYKTGTDGKLVGVFLVVTYLLSAFVGGLYLGKRMEQKRYLWGILAAVLYFSVYCLITTLLNREMAKELSDYVKTFFLLVLGGMLGGMLS